jgi:hypothetical protein
VELPDGDLLVCWFHGSGERTADDVKIEGARSDRQTGKWSERMTMADTPGIPDRNPTVLIDSRQPLFFLASGYRSAVGKAPRDEELYIYGPQKASRQPKGGIETIII